MNWKQPIFYRIERRWRLLEALISLLMVFLILSAMWSISSTSSIASLNPWVILAILVTSTLESAVRNMAVIIPANRVSKEEGGTL